MADPAEVYVTGPDGQEYRTGGDTLRDYLANGYTVSKNQPNFRGVPVRLPDGTAAELDPQRAEEVIRSGGGDVIDRGTLLADQERQVYGGGAGQAAAAAAGLARGATLGLSDVVAGAIDPTLPGGLRQLQEANPATSTATELGGNIASLLATGGGAGLGSLATRGAVKLGAVEGGLAARALAGAAVGAAEMGAIEAGRELSQATLQERETSAARVAEAFGHGALLGGAFGGALPLAGAALSGVASGARRVAGKVVPGGSGSLADDALAYAREKTLKSTGGTQKEIGKILDASPELRQAADDILIRDVPKALGKSEAAVVSRAEMQAGIETARQEIGAEMGKALKAIDTNARGVGADISGIVSRARETVLAPLEANVFAGAEARAVAKQIQQLEKLQDYRVGFESLHDLSSQLGKVIRKNPTAAATQDLKAFRSLIEDEIITGANRVSGEIGGDIAGQYATARTRYAAAKMLEDAVATGVKAETKNLTFSLSSMLAGGTGTSLGATVGGAVLGPVGAAIGGVVGGVGGAVLANLNKRFGDQVVSQALRAYAQGETRMVASLVDNSIAQGVGKMLSGGAKATKRLAPVVAADAATRTALLGRSPAPLGPRTVDRRAPPGGASPQQTAQIRTTIQQSAEQQRQAIGAAMAAAPPEVAATLRGQLAASERATTYLLSKIPLSGNQKNTLTPQAEAPRLTKAQLDELVTAARVVADPLSVLESLERGDLRRVEVEALRVAAPGLYQQIRTEVQAQLSERTEPLPYRQALQLSQLLGVVGHPSLSPASIQAIQASYAPAPQESPPAPVRAPKRPISTTKDWSLTSEEP
ncbi:MAG: hypothetical protein IPL79_19865 [Myxococcales bacterium]|nr:hypothetical protein [Myxococcales bacterium]